MFPIDPTDRYPMKKLLLSLTLLLAVALTTSAQITYTPAQPCAGDIISFSHNFSIPSGASCFWNFSDGSTGSPCQTDFYTSPVWANNTLIAWLTIADSSGVLFQDTATILIQSNCCTKSLISGKVFYDQNNNGIEDLGEPPYAGKSIQISPAGYLLTPDNNGNFQVCVADSGVQTVSMLLDTLWTQTFPNSPVSYTVNLTGNGDTLLNNDFGAYCPPGTQNLLLSLGGSVVRSGFSTFIAVLFKNAGASTVSGTIPIIHSPFLTSNSNGPAFTSSGDTLTYAFNNLLPGESRWQYFSFNASSNVALGTTYTYTGSILPLSGDVSPSDNTDSINGIVIGSYDPNDKQIIPGGDGPMGLMPPTDQLTYRVRFQNTGTFYAENVRIEDTLDANLDPASIQVTSASHPYYYRVDGNAFTMYFDSIILLDSNTNEPLSHGFFTFTADVIDGPNLPLGTTIPNTAHIYFDFNEAIVTNTAMATWDIPASVQTTLPLDDALSLYPNPSSGLFTLRFEDAEMKDLTVEIFDAMGRQVYRAKWDQLPDKELQLSANALGLYNGIYHLRVASTQGKFTRKLVVRK